MNLRKRLRNSLGLAPMLVALIMLFFTGCSSTQPMETGAPGGPGSANETDLPATTEAVSESEALESRSTGPETPGGNGRMIYAHVNGKTLKLLAAENSSAEAFLDLLKARDVTIEMHDYGSFEKVGPLGTTLPRNDVQITTEPGDVILYQGNQVTIYYDVNSWSFTRLGKVQGLSQAELKEILGTGDAVVTFSLSEGAGGRSLIICGDRPGSHPE